MTNEEQFHVFDAIDHIPEFQGAGVACIGDGSCDILRDTQHISGSDTWIVLEATETPKEGKLEAPKQAKTRPSFLRELLSFGINCSSAVLTGAAAAAETAAAPVTAGASLPLDYITGAGALATSLQCGLSVGRIVDQVIDPDLQWSVQENSYPSIHRRVLIWLSRRCYWTASRVRLPSQEVGVPASCKRRSLFTSFRKVEIP